MTQRSPYLVPSVQALKQLDCLDDVDLLACLFIGGALSAGVEPILNLLMEGRRDSSGDFALGAGLSLRAAKLVLYATIGNISSIAAYREWCAVLFSGEDFQRAAAAPLRGALS